MWNTWLVICIYVTKAIGETVYLEDLNNDHDRRNLDFGLPEMMSFRLAHGGGVVDLNLRENKLLNAVNAPVLVAAHGDYGRRRAVEVNLPPNNRVKFYQDVVNEAYMTAQCLAQPQSPCSRKLTGNLVIGDAQYKLEPVDNSLNTRAFPVHLGSPHTLELLETRTYTSSEGDNGTAVSTELDYVIPGSDDADSGSDNEDPDDEDTRELRELLLRDLLEKLEALRELQKRQTGPIAHGVEMFLIIDHVIFQRFSEIYPDETEALYAIREFFSHIVNGVDLRYATIQDDDISIYVTIAGFYVSTSVTNSTWMDYTENPTDGMEGLKSIKYWRDETDGIPKHDHIALITGSNIQASGSGSVAGIAYVGGVCSSSYGVSINEEKGFFKGSGILAHELGHNLGASHDEGGGGCGPSDKYVMAPKVPFLSASSKTLNPWRFSSCSVDSMKKYLKGLGKQPCTQNRANVWDDKEFEKHTQGLAGQLYTEDDQCGLLLGSGSKMCNTGKKNTEEVCRDLSCTRPGTTKCSRFLPAHGTPCGDGRLCFEGVCQDGENETSTVMPSTTEEPMSTTPSDPYVCSDSGVAQYSCKELLSFLGTKKRLCSRFGYECCQTCTNKKFCKKDKSAVKLKKSYTCEQLMDLWTKNTGCRLFTKDCCVTCRQ